MATVLLASLGESPAVVTAMYDLLTKKKKIPIDIVDVLYPTGGYVKDAYGLIEDEFNSDMLRYLKLPFEDVNSKTDAVNFLVELFQRLDKYQANDDIVYLSLAGGRKSMAALMAWVAPLFSCIQMLCHVVDPSIDPQDESFPSIEKMILEMNPVERKQAMHPNLDQLSLVKIPFEKEQRISQELREKLLNGSVEELVAEGFDEEAVESIKIAKNGEKAVPVKLTKRAAKQFEDLRSDFQHAREFESCFKLMRFPAMVRKGVHNLKGDKQNPRVRATLHFFKRDETLVRPVFYTEPDISHCADDKIEKVVVCELVIENPGRVNPYPHLRDLTVPGSSFLWEQADILAETLPPVKRDHSEESILIVPLGAYPMVATQLYTLLTEREEWKIKEIALICPENEKIIAGAESVNRALQNHTKLHGKSNVSCKQIRVPGVKDITSEKDCQEYQNKLEKEIQGTRDRGYSPQQIILALSGGRKGMTAMTLFAAQKQRIPYVYHTLIEDEELSQDIEKKTRVDKLPSNRRDRDELLFLGKYKGNGPVPYPDFAIFKVPVFPAGK